VAGGSQEEEPYEKPPSTKQILHRGIQQSGDFDVSSHINPMQI
jgi:hypothetical protein